MFVIFTSYRWSINSVFNLLQIVRRYAEFTSALLVSSQQSGLPIDDRLQVLLTQLQAQIEQLLAKLSHHFKAPKEQLICSINNYDIILCILAVSFVFLSIL
jgi:hypothetical protein